MAGWASLLAADRPAVSHVRPVVVAVLLPVGAVGKDDAHPQVAARTTPRRSLPSCPLPAPPANPLALRSDHLQAGRESLYLLVVLVACPVVENGAVGVDRLAVPLHCRHPVCCLVRHARARRAGREQLLVCRTGISGAVAEEVVAGGSARLSKVHNRVVGSAVAEGAIDGEARAVIAGCSGINRRRRCGGSSRRHI